MRRIGAHMSISGGVSRAIERAEESGCEALKIFARNPRGWRASVIADQEAEAFRQSRAVLKLSPLIIHSPYLINLSAPDADIYRKSLESFRRDLVRADFLGADGYVLHVGFHKGEGIDAGIKKMAESLGQVIGSLPNIAVKIMLENTASAGTSIGHRFDYIARIMELSGFSEKLFLCFDTCHAFVAGHDISSEEGLNETLTEVDRLIGLDRMSVIHFNDSLYPCNSRRDRHAHIGEGMIGEEGMRRILLHPLLDGKTYILETPKKNPEDDMRNLSLVKRWRDEGEGESRLLHE